MSRCSQTCLGADTVDRSCCESYLLQVSQLVLCDSRDIRGHAEALHQETQGPVIFIFDFLEGGRN